MRSGATMKVSLTPDRLKSMEVRHHCCRTPVHAERQPARAHRCTSRSASSASGFPVGRASLRRVKTVASSPRPRPILRNTSAAQMDGPPSATWTLSLRMKRSRLVLCTPLRRPCSQTVPYGHVTPASLRAAPLPAPARPTSAYARCQYPTSPTPDTRTASLARARTPETASLV